MICRRLIACALLLSCGMSAGEEGEPANLFQRTPLHHAAEAGDAEACRQLLAEGAAPDARELIGLTPLLLAAAEGHTQACLALIEAGAAVNAHDENGDTPLHAAAVGAHADACRALLAAGADARAVNDMQYTPLMYWLLCHADVLPPTELLSGSDLSAADERGATALHLACEQPELCRALLDAGANPNAADAEGNTPLHRAAADGSAEVCRMLLAVGADPALRNAEGATPAQLALAAGADVAELLPPPADSTPTCAGGNPALRAEVERLFSPDAADALVADTRGPEWRFVQDLLSHSELCAKGMEAAQDFPYLLYYCVVCHHQRRAVEPAVLRALMAAGADVNACDTAGATVFHWAVATAQGELCSLLLELGARADEWPPLHLAAILNHAEECGRIISEAGADVNALSAAGWSPLMYAARFGYADVCRLLLEAGADASLGAEGAEGALMPLHNAVEQGHADICRLLLSHGADPNATYAADITPLYIAVARGDADTCRALLEGGADANKRRSSGEAEPPLCWAAMRGNEEICRLLLAAGADPAAADSEGNTPLHHAAMAGSEPVCRLLLEAGVSPTLTNIHGLTPADLANMENYDALSRFLKTAR